MTPTQVLQKIKREKIAYVDLHFMDFPGFWQSVTLPAAELRSDAFSGGIGFDGSCVRGWQAINEADMLLLPVAGTAYVDPFAQEPTLGMICDIKDPVTKKLFSRDPRSVARKAGQYLKQSKVADKAMFGPEIEFFLFDHVQYDQTVNQAGYRVDSAEGSWNRGSHDPTNLGYQQRRQGGIYPTPPTDRLRDIRAQMVTFLRGMGVAVEQLQHEVATGGQCEIDLKHLDLIDMADAVMLTKYVIRNVASRHGMAATFMPKPLFTDNGSGMHTHFSLWKQGKPLFSGNRYAGLSQQALYAIGGLLKHAPALIAFTNPTTNSFKRLVPGYEAPVHLVYSSRNRAAAVRVPVYHDTAATKRLEFRCPDPSCNPYLAFSAMVMAAMDGIRQRIDPGEPMDKNINDLDPAVYEAMATAPADMEQALLALEQDHDFLLEGGVFDQSLIHYWIKYKRENELNALRQRPHPYEFCMYFDV